MTFAEMCKKKMEPMKESERTRTIKGSLWNHEKKLFQNRIPKAMIKWKRTLGGQVNHPCKVWALCLMTRPHLLHEMSLVVMTLVKFLHVVYSTGFSLPLCANKVHEYIHTEFDLHPEVSSWLQSNDYQLGEGSQSRTTMKLLVWCKFQDALRYDWP